MRKIEIIVWSVVIVLAFIGWLWSAAMLVNAGVNKVEQVGIKGIILSIWEGNGVKK